MLLIFSAATVSDYILWFFFCCNCSSHSRFIYIFAAVIFALNFVCYCCLQAMFSVVIIYFSVVIPYFTAAVIQRLNVALTL